MHRTAYRHALVAIFAAATAMLTGCQDSTGPRDDTPPSVIANSPANGANMVSTFATVTVTFGEPMDSSSINASTFGLAVAATGAPISGRVTYSSVTQRAEFTPAGSLPGATNLTVTMTTGAKDMAGNGLAAPFKFSFTTLDQTPPTVTSTSPANGGTLVAATGPITVTFSKAMDASTINGINLTLRLTSNGATLNAPVTFNAATRTATLTPVSVLSAPRTFTVTVASAVKDSVGNPMAADFQFAFNTGDGTSPTVVAIVPPDGKIGATIGSVVRVTFSEPMDPSSFGSGSIQLMSTTNGDVSGTLSYDNATRTATFTPTQLLRESNTYKATVSAAVRDVSGLSMASPVQWTFVTVDNTPPTANVSALPLAAGSSFQVELNAVFTVSFSEAIDSSTLNSSTFSVRNFTTSINLAGALALDSSNRFATFTPSSRLTAGTRYTATVTKGVKDPSGNALDHEFTKDFFTTFTPDTIAPFVYSTSPSDGETGVRTNGIITVLFPENVQGVSKSSFFLRNATTGAPIDGIVSQAPDYGPQKFILTPRFELDKNTRYTVTLTTAIHDYAGNAMAQNFTFSFTTAP